jgi:hypothetical protein
MLWSEGTETAMGVPLHRERAMAGACRVGKCHPAGDREAYFRRLRLAGLGLASRSGGATGFSVLMGS